jgi:polysaccharide pyruvyl transferase WcaK-like protein
MSGVRRTHATVALFGLFGGGNLGNEASLGAALGELEKRAARVRCVLISSPPGHEAAITGFDACLPHDVLPIPRSAWARLPWRLRSRVRSALQMITEPLRFRRTVRAVRGFDMLLVPGTGIADDYGVEPLDVPHHIARWCRAARHAGVPVMFLSIGAGPVTHPLSRRFFREALASATYRSFRESASRDFAAELGVDARNDPVLPDLVFSLGAESAPPVSWPPRVIALGVMGYFGWHATRKQGIRIYRSYLDKLERLTIKLLREGYQVRLIIGNRGGDRRAVRDLTDRINASSPDLATGLMSPVIQSYGDVVTHVAAADLVIATRFHNVLKALLTLRPVISIGYARKNENLMAEMGLEAYCHSVEDFDPGAVLAQVREMAALPAPPTSQLAARLPVYREALASQFEQVLAPISTIGSELAQLGATVPPQAQTELEIKG